MYNRRYDKAFFMLQPEMNGADYGEGQRTGSGTIKIKNGKGKLSVYAQGLRKSNESIYKVYLISSNPLKTIGLPTAMIEVDNKGQGETEWDFDPENVGGSGITIDDFNVIAVIVKSYNGQSQSIISPLVGYKNAKVNWKNNFVEYNKEYKEIMDRPIEAVKKEQTKKESQNREEKKADTKKEVIFQEFVSHVNENKEKQVHVIDFSKEENVTAEKASDSNEIKKVSSYKQASKTNRENMGLIDESVVKKAITAREHATEQDFYGDYHIMADTTPHDTFKEIAEKFKKEMDELQRAGVLSAAEVNRVKSTGIENKVSDIDYIFINNEKMTPFENEDNCNWARIGMDEIALLPIKNYRMMRHPFIAAGCKKYSHLILGEKKEEDKYSYFLGVPDAYLSEYKLMASRLGFQEFKCCDSKPAAEGSYGYWIMNI